MRPSFSSSTSSALSSPSFAGVAFLVIFLFSVLFLSAMIPITVQSLSTDETDGKNEDPKRRAIRLKTSGQLKKIFDELGVLYNSQMTKEELRDLAFKENAVERWMDLHPEKKKKKTTKEMPDFGGQENVVPPEGIDPEQWQRILAQMRGDFSYEKDPEKRRILQKLKARGMSVSGASDMTLDKLKEMEKLLDKIGSGGEFARDGGGFGGRMPKDDL